MKKIIGILGVVMIAIAVFVGSNSSISNVVGVDLLSVININAANAESGPNRHEAQDGCINLWTWEVVGYYKNCLNGGPGCTETDC